jgi:NitT/TauT family transport system substrate-binding protein
MTTEPSATRAIQSGAAVRVMGDDEIYPNHQLAVVLYSGNFIKSSPDAGKRFMRAYLRGVRDYNDALKDGKIAGPNADEVIAILVESTEIKDAAVFRAINAQGTNPNGRVHEPSLRNDLRFYIDEGLIQGKVTLEQTLDNSFVEAALKDLGEYRPRAARK